MGDTQYYIHGKTVKSTALPGIPYGYTYCITYMVDNRPFINVSIITVFPRKQLKIYHFGWVRI